MRAGLFEHLGQRTTYAAHTLYVDDLFGQVVASKNVPYGGTDAGQYSPGRVWAGIDGFPGFAIDTVHARRELTDEQHIVRRRPHVDTGTERAVHGLEQLPIPAQQAYALLPFQHPRDG